MLEKIRENPAMTATVVAVVAVLGGTFAVELPADRKVAELESQIAQTWQQREAWQQGQQQYHKRRELDDVDWRLRYLSNEINRIQKIPDYLGRSLTPEESWQIQQLREEWRLLKERRQRLSE